MTWDEGRSRSRIHKFLDTVPQFADRLTLREHSRARMQANKSGLVSGASPRTAFVVNGAHLYGQVLNFDELVAQNDQETPTSHQNLLGTLHLHYQLWDSIVDDEEAERIDYHGARMHAVVTDPHEDPREQILNSMALAVRLMEASKTFDESHRVRLRFGIDQGPCLAMTTGRAHEKDVLFLGKPANHAAKLVAAADVEGIFLTPTAQKILGASNVLQDARGGVSPGIAILQEAVRKYPFKRITDAAAKLKTSSLSRAKFVFNRVTPPLSDVAFRDLSPAKSIRMGIAVVFADIDGFTKYVDAAIQNGQQAIKEAATRMHVIREELNAVLQDDFRGKRVRFIGDCIHGALAAGDSRNDDPTAAVRDAVMCSAGMMSSFRLMQGMLGSMQTLDLAIGVEYGPTPMTRLGLRGDESVRCSTSRAVVRSEHEQQEIRGGGIRLGPVALNLADPAIRSHFSRDSRIPLYETAIKSFGGGSGGGLLRPAAAAAVPLGFPNRPVTPTKPDGFA